MDVPLETRERDLITEWLKEKKLLQKEFIEVGCGDGFNLEAFSELGMKGTGIDISLQALGIARGKKLPNIRIEKADFLRLKAQTDIVFMLNFLEHVDNVDAFLERAHLLLRRGGHLVIAVPSNPKSYGYADMNAGHLRRFDENELAASLKQTGFRIEGIYHAGFPVNDFYTGMFNFINKRKKTEGKNLISGIRHKKGYYPGSFGLLSKILFPILTVLIKIDALFLKTKLGNNLIVFCRKV